MATTSRRLNLTRDQLAAFLQDQQAIRQFELLLELVNSVTGSYVASFTAGETGFTPNTATSGQVVLDGVLNVAHGGTNSATIEGAPFALKGANADISSLSGITGGISTADYIEFDQAGFTHSTGRLGWEAAQSTLVFNLDANVLCRVGQSLIAKVVNAEAVTINKGQAVYLYQAQGDRATVKLAYNTGDATSAKTFGLAAESIGPNQIGMVMCQGVLENVNTSAFSAGDTLYLGATPGSLTATKPNAPNHLVYAGVVERANVGGGQIYVKVQNGYELDEIHDVQITSLADKDFLQYDLSTDLWKNKTPASVSVGGLINGANGYNFTNASVASGGGAATVSATLPTGSVASTNKWLEIQVNGTPYWLPIWSK
jgi:hypothetical protein